MGSLTLEQLTSEIKAFHGDRSDFDSRLTSIINLAQTRISRLSRWEELNKTYNGTLSSTGTLANDKIFQLPVRTRTIQSIRVFDSNGTKYRKLVGLTTKRFDKYLTRPEAYSRGFPEAYTRWGDTIELFQIPDQDYSIDIRYIAYPADLVSGQTSELEQKDDAIIMLCVSWMYLSLKRRNEANTYWLVYKKMMEEAIGEDRESPDIQFGPTVRDGGSFPTPWANPFIKSIR